jgi:hypothetical protein
MQNNDFAVFILTHGRPNNVKTIATLKKCDYTGDIYFIVDNEDKMLYKYYENFGTEKVKVFNKKQLADEVDEGNNFDERRTITHARNACFDIAKQLNITYFIQLDDDYTSFRYRYIDKYKTIGYLKDINKLFASLLEFYIATSFTSIALSQGGDFIGGEQCGLLTNYLYNSRKCMNSFLCSTKRRFQFIGAMNEDVNTYVVRCSRGELFLTIPFVGLDQTATQSNKGGITDMYIKYGTYCKAFTTVMMHPSSVVVSMLFTNNSRIHHRINWKTTVPLIISEKYKK